MNNIFDEILKECKNNFAFKRISSSHPLDLYLGYNGFGKKTLALIVNDVKMNFLSTKLIDVTIASRQDSKKAVCFALMDDTETDIFYKFCEDIYESTLHAKADDSITIIHNRWNRWINVFKNPHSLIMGEKEIRGLIGELVFLRDYMFDIYSVAKAIEAWIGPTNGHKDIEIDNTWYEVKTCYQSSKSVEISSVEQLDSNIDGHLCIVELENSNKYAAGSLNLNDLIDQIVNLIPSEETKNNFLEKVAKVGYFYCEEYNNYIYLPKNINLYLVDNKFPRLKKDNLPKEIFTASYELLIPNLRSFLEVD